MNLKYDYNELKTHHNLRYITEDTSSEYQFALSLHPFALTLSNLG